MGRAQCAAAIFIIVILASPLSAQRRMGAAEYRDFLGSLDLSAARWQLEIETFHVEDLSVSFSLGKSIDGQKQLALKNIALIPKTIHSQLANERLSNDINLDGSLLDVSNMLSGIVSIMPDREESVSWSRKFVDLNDEIGPLELSLRKQVLAYADQLQAQADRCQR
jgi:hypothetical protein